MKKIGIIADDSSEIRVRVILYSGLEDQSRLLTFAREDTKYIPNIHNNQKIKEDNTFYHFLTNFVHMPEVDNFQIVSNFRSLN
jgi:hypothetical protein